MQAKIHRWGRRPVPVPDGPPFWMDRFNLVAEPGRRFSSECCRVAGNQGAKTTSCGTA